MQVLQLIHVTEKGPQNGKGSGTYCMTLQMGDVC